MPVARGVRRSRGSAVSFSPGRAKPTPKRSRSTTTMPVPNSYPKRGGGTVKQ
jgi:hypothetical protein